MKMYESLPLLTGAKGIMLEIISIINHQLDRSRIFGCVVAKKCNIGEKGSATALLIFSPVEADVGTYY